MLLPPEPDPAVTLDRALQQTVLTAGLIVDTALLVWAVRWLSARGTTERLSGWLR